MPHLDLKMAYHLDLSAKELALVVRALSNMLKPEQLSEAKELSDALTRMRSSSVQNAIKANEQLVRNLEAPNAQ
jgi:hypothetical protein